MIGPLDPAPAANVASQLAAGSVGNAGLSSSMPPFMPPMMGANSGQNERDRERTTWLAEEEDVWGTDPDVAVAVIGRDEAPERSGDRTPWTSPTPKTTTSPRGPARGSARRD
jgi:hypothetical protein